MVEASFTIRMVPFMTVNGFKTKDMDEVRSSTQMGQSTMESGTQTKSMVMAFTCQTMVIALRALSTKE